VQPQAITSDMVDQLGLKSTRGALIADVVKDSPAAKSGLKPGDVIVAVNGRPVADNNQLTRDIGAVQPGQTVKLDVIREGKQKTIEVKVAPRPDEKDEVLGGGSKRGQDEQGKGDLLGLRVDDLTPEMARRARIDSDTKGAVVTDVAPDSPASEAGLEGGDVIVEVNRQPVASAADYKKATKGLKKGDTALVRVKRGQATQYVPVRVK
jgi:serine protease Do